MECLELIKDKIDKLKQELGIEKDVENWENVSVSITTIRSGKNKKLKSITLRASTPRKKPKGRTLYIKSFPEETPKEEIQKTEEFQKAKKLATLIKAYKVLEDVLENI